LCKALGMPELEHDPRFETIEDKMANNKELIEILDSVFLTKTSKEWETSLREAGALFSVVNTFQDLATDSQVIANNYMLEVDHPIFGKARFPGFPVRLSRTPMTFRSIAPELGQDTEEILLNIGGYNWDEITKLKDEEVI